MKPHCINSCPSLGDVNRFNADLVPLLLLPYQVEVK